MALVVHGGFSFQPCGSKHANKCCGKSVMNVWLDFYLCIKFKSRYWMRYMDRSVYKKKNRIS